MESITTKFLNKEDDKTIVYTGEFQITHPESTITATGIIYYSSLPFPNIYFEGTSKENSLIHAFANELKLMTSETDFGTVALNTTTDLNGITELYGEILTQTHTKFEQETINECLLHVTNFLDFYGDTVRSLDKNYPHGILINHNGWEIQIQKRYDFGLGNYDVHKNLNKLNSYDITHIIKIKKHDGTDFKREDLKDILEVWQWTLNFAMGRHVGIPIEIGLNHENIVYEKYKKPLISEFIKQDNWFSNRQGKELGQLFSCLFNTINDELIFSEIKKIIHTYIEANLSTFVEFKIILAQIALEKLSWLLLHDIHTPNYSKTQYNNLGSFGAKLETTLSKEVNFSSQLPSKLSHLVDKDNNSITGPHAINQLRNDIAHPIRLQNLPISDKAHISQLALLYIEKCSLHLIGYKGQFNNRIS